MAYFPQTCSLNKPTWYAMKNLPRKKDQIGVMMTSYPCSSFDMCCSLSLSLTLSLSLKWVNAAWYKYIQNRLLNSYIENQIVTSIISYPTIKKFIIVKKKVTKYNIKKIYY